MKFQFLKGLFSSDKIAHNKQEILDQIPDNEISELIDAAIDEVVIEPEILISKRDSSNKNQEVIILRPEPILSVSSVPIKFIIKKEINGSRFELDNVNNISRITWSGNVNFETAKELLTLGADSVEILGYDKLLLDRSALTEFETEARVWIKGLLKTRAKKIVKNVSKVAMINAKSAKGSLFSNFIGSAISMVFPDLQLKKFNSVEESLAWLLSK